MTGEIKRSIGQFVEYRFDGEEELRYGYLIQLASHSNEYGPYGVVMIWHKETDRIDTVYADKVKFIKEQEPEEISDSEAFKRQGEMYQAKIDAALKMINHHIMARSSAGDTNLGSLMSAKRILQEL